MEMMEIGWFYATPSMYYIYIQYVRHVHARVRMTRVRRALLISIVSTRLRRTRYLTSPR